MTIRDANAVNTVIDAILEARDRVPIGMTSINNDSVCDALIVLADAANKALSAGVRGDTIRRQWPKPDGWRLGRGK